MLKVTPITDILYLAETASNAGTALSYYADTGARSEPPGQWWCPGNWIVNDYEEVKPLAVARLAQGRHPVTGRQIVAGRGEKKRAATDLTFSAPKSWTSLWTVSDENNRLSLDQMLLDAVRESLDEILKTGLIEARIGKGGVIREPMAGLVAALYRHTTSREGDPQAHVHAALLNVGLRADGHHRATNNEQLCTVHKVVGATFRLRLAEKLEACGVRVHADLEHGFVIAEQPEELADIWSKRRKQIVQAAGDSGLTSTAGKLKRVDRLVKQTRGKKKDLPSLKQLEYRWREEAREAGWTPQAVWTRLDKPAITRTPRQEELAATATVYQAIQNITETKSLFRRHEVEALALSLAVGRCGAMAIRKALDMTLASPKIVDLHLDGMLTTGQIIAQEAEIVQIARSNKSELFAGFSATACRVAVDDKKFSIEQKDAIAHALSASGVSAVQGGPGVGKTTTTVGIKRACDQDGRRLILLAPSWTAAETVRDELAHKGPALAVDKFLYDLRAGELTLQHTDVVLIDEAGMISTTQMLSLMQAASHAGAKLILQGDSNQIASVARGDPLSLVVAAIGSEQIRTIRRQVVDWQRAASEAAQEGLIEHALTSYYFHDAVNVAVDDEGALAGIVDAFKTANGEAIAIAATNQTVADINAVLRQAAREIGVVTGPEIIINAMPRGRKTKPKAIPLHLAVGDKLILGGEAKIGGITLRNASRLKVREILPGGARIVLETNDGQQLMTSAAELASAGKGGRPVIMQHAYAVTVHAAQGATWPRTLWLTSHEDRRSALVAMTRHRDSLSVFISRSRVPNHGDVTMNVGRSGLTDPDQPEDERTDMEIVAAVARSMERNMEPRNAHDILSLPDDVPVEPRRATIWPHTLGRVPVPPAAASRIYERNAIDDCIRPLHPRLQAKINAFRRRSEQLVFETSSKQNGEGWDICVFDQSGGNYFPN